MAKLFLPVSILVFCGIFCATAAAIPAELQPGKAQEGALHEGKGPIYILRLKASEYVESDVDLRTTELVISVYDPAGKSFRTFWLDSDYGTQLRFIAETAGIYRLEVAGQERSKTGSFSITVSKTMSLEERLSTAPLPERYESAAIKQLRADLSAGKPDAVAGFWKEARTNTTPLLEPIAGDKQSMLVTFLWQGNETTRNVLVDLFPYDVAWPDDYRMAQLGNANIWYKTIKMNRQTRCVYRLAPNATYFAPTRDGDLTRRNMSFVSGRTDPLNPRHWLHDPENPDNPDYQDWSALELPDASPQPWTAPRAGVPAGTLETSRFKSAMLNNERDMVVYLPPGL